MDRFAPVALPAPQPARFQRSTSSAEDEEIAKLFDGAAKRRRVAWMFALVALLAVAAMTVAAVASHFRPI